MEKRKLITTTGLLLLATVTCNAQDISTSKLANTVWTYEYNGIFEFLEFSKDSIWETSYSSYSHNTIRYSKPYYLSEDKKEPFNMKKVGTSTSGKYLLRWNMKMKEKEYCEITTLTKDTLVLFFEAQPHYIGAADISFTYKRVR